MTQVFIALGVIDYEGRDIIGVYSSADEAVERCRESERLRAADDDADIYFSAYYVQTWTVGRIHCDESQYFTRDQL